MHSCASFLLVQETFTSFLSTCHILQLKGELLGMLQQVLVQTNHNFCHPTNKVSSAIVISSKYQQCISTVNCEGHSAVQLAGAYRLWVESRFVQAIGDH